MTTRRSSRQGRTAAVLAAVFSCLVLGSPVDARISGRPFFSDPALSDADRARLHEAIEEVLESREVGRTSEWSNAQAGTAAKVKLVRSYWDERLEVPCGTVGILVVAQASRRKLVFSFCEVDGDWKVSA